MKINSELKNGLAAVDVLSKNPGYMAASQIATHIGADLDFLQQIMRKLRIAGVIEVRRGPGGGFKLAGKTTAYKIALALGRDFGPLSFNDEDSNSRLSKAVIEAFIGLEIG